MAEFLDFEAIDEDLRSNKHDIADTENDDDGNVSDNFIDGEHMFGESVEELLSI